MKQLTFCPIPRTALKSIKGGGSNIAAAVCVPASCGAGRLCDLRYCYCYQPLLRCYPAV